jgi:hypothetical protein
VDVRLTAPLTLEDVQTLNAWLQEPKPVDVSHVVIDPKQVSVGSQRDWNDLRCASTPRGTDLRSDLNTAVAKLQPRRLGFEASR